MHQKASKSAPIRAAENICRREASGVYYAVARSVRKQFRRSFKTTTRDPDRRREFVAFCKTRADLAKADTVHMTLDVRTKRSRRTGFLRGQPRVS
jgi:hypothetical protein